MYRPTWRWTQGIAIVGAECSGKSTLLAKLEPLIEAPVIRELVRTLIRESGLVTPPAFGSDYKVTKRFQEELHGIRVKAHLDAETPFLEDRSTIDSYAYSLAGCGRDPASQEWFEEFSVLCRKHARSFYNFVILVPSGKFAMESDGLRNPLPYNAMMMYYLIQGLLIDWEIPFHTLESVNIEDRVAESIEVLRQLNLISVKYFT